MVYNGNMLVLKKSAIVIFLFAFSLMGMGVFPIEVRAEDSVDELEDKYAKTLKKLKEEEKEAALLHSKLTGINQNLSATDRAIMATQTAINATRSDLERKILEIQLLEQQVAQREEYLTEMIRELYAELGVVEVQDMLRLDASETVTPERDAEPWLIEFIASLTV